MSAASVSLDLYSEAILKMRALRIVLGILATALSAILIVILTGVVVDWTMGSAYLAKPMVNTVESPGWARFLAFLWSGAGFAGVVFGALPALLLTRLRKWTEVKRLAIVVCGGGLAGAVVGFSIGGPQFAAAASAAALIMSYVFWWVAGR